MAEAVRHEAVTKVVEPEKVVLTLSREEAEALAYLTQWLIGGEPDASARRYTEAVARALREAGITTRCGDRRFRVKAHWSAVHFRNLPQSDFDPFDEDDKD